MMIHKFNFRIAYADTDADGVVYHARYIEIAERARMEASKDIIETDGFFVVAELAIKYKKPLKIKDEIIVETIFKKPRTASMQVEQNFTKDGKVHAIITVTLVYVDKNFKPIRVPDIWLKLGENNE